MKIFYDNLAKVNCTSHSSEACIMAHECQLVTFSLYCPLAECYKMTPRLNRLSLPNIRKNIELPTTYCWHRGCDVLRDCGELATITSETICTTVVV